MQTTDNITTLPVNENQEPEAAESADMQIEAYVNMAVNRRNMAAPDVDAAWKTFVSARRGGLGNRRAAAVLRAVVYAAIGSAAMFAFMFFTGVGRGSHDGAGRQTVGSVAKNTVSSADTAGFSQQNNTSGRAKQALLRGGDQEPVTVAKANAGAAQPMRVSTPGGMDLRIQLPDGSEVMLNAGSSVDFPSSFMGGERRVRLSGEAYFKVAHNPKKPFIVTSDQMQVRVLGTEFNFKSYSSEPAAVTLINGKVEILNQETEKAVATLSPGKEAWYDKDGEIRISDADTYAVTQWVKGYFYFRDKPLVAVLKELGRWYNLGVVFHNRKALDYKVHFSALRNAGIDAALESLNRLQRISVRVEDGNIAVY